MKRVLSGIVSVSAVAAACAAVGPDPQSWVGGRFYGCIEKHVIAEDPVALSDYFKTHEETWQWQTEFWGKYMHSAVPLWELTHNAELKKKIDAGVDNLVSAQLADGYIGNYKLELRAQEMWDVWGMKYTLLGLLHYHDACLRAGEKDRAEKALAAAVKLADFVLAEVGPAGKRRIVTTGNYGGLASCSILEPIVWLAWRTGEERYEAFARSIVDQVGYDQAGPQLVTRALADVPPATRGPWTDTKHCLTKAYEMMSCYQGLLAYYYFKGRPAELADLHTAAAKTAREIIKREINVIGGSCSNEHWYEGGSKQCKPYLHQNETCVTTTWLRLLETLYAFDADPAWMDAWEKTFYNVYLGAQSPDRRWFASYPALSGTRAWQREQLKGCRTNCCNANGARGFVSLLRTAFRRDEKGACLNVFCAGEWAVPGMRVKVETQYPFGSAVKVTVLEKTGDKPLALARRVPAFAAADGRAGRIELSADAKAGDVFSFDVPLAWKDVVLDDHIAFTRGPVAYVRPSGDDAAIDLEHFPAAAREAELKALVPYADAVNGCRTWIPALRHPWNDFPCK